MRVLYGEHRNPTELGKPVPGKLDFVELVVEPGRTPKPAKLAELRRRSKPDLAFSVVAGDACLEADPSAALELVVQAVEVLGARFLIVRAPSSLRPGRASEQRIERALRSLDSVSGTTLLFEASGLWQPQATRALCRRWGVQAVDRLEDIADAFELPARPYVRVVQIGTGRSRLPKHVDAAARSLAQCDEAAVVVQGGGLARVRSAFEAILGDVEPDGLE